MTTQLYLITETYSEEGKIADITNNLSTVSCKPMQNGNYDIKCRPVTYHEVTLQDLITAVENELENANHHSATSLPTWLVDIMQQHMPEAIIKEVVWHMIQDKGFLWI